MSLTRILGCGLVSFAILGCGGGSGDLPDMGTVSGTVNIDGKPTEDVSVTFAPVEGGRSSSAITDSAGHYELTYSSDVKGAVIGQHNVFVAGYVEHDSNDPNAPMVPPPGNVPKDYREISKQVEVKQGENQIDLSYP